MNRQSQKPSRSTVNKLPKLQCPQIRTAGGERVIKRVLIANRGEIACRVIKTSRRIGITSIAVFTEPDAASLFVKEADEAIPLGPISGPGGNPHLSIGVLVKAAQEHRADAIHPGYGYLSENPEFAREVQRAGILFLGPSPESMAVLGNKRAAKDYLLEHAPEVPLIPGYNGSEQSVDRLTKEADRIGYPVLIKASAGGGGKGMRIIHERNHFSDELARAQSEAERSFGSSDCIIEKYIERSKHIEIQILGDIHGQVVSLLDRECTIQRRHQKVIEEAPSPWLSIELRQAMSKTAMHIGKLLRYVSAGTVEFIVDVDTAKYYFLEVNTRIQVEHPITEETTGTDIVALQVYVASGGSLDELGYFDDNGLSPQAGHAIECRLCAEDPSRDFYPDLGTIQRWTPASEILPISRGEYARFDAGIETGSQILIHFDSLMAKIVVWAPTRSEAVTYMAKLLAHTVCIGIRSNQAFLQSCLLHEKFRDPEYTTSFIPKHMSTLIRNPYVKSLDETIRLFSFIPSMLQQQRTASNTRKGPFASVRPSFKNQRMDPANIQASFVRIPILGNETILVSWSAGQELVRMIPLGTTDSKQEADPNMKPSVRLARKYNAISAQIRGLSNADIATLPLHRVTMQIRGGRTDLASREEWSLGDLSVTVNTQRHAVYTACSPHLTAEPGSFQEVYAHIPGLGTYVKYHSFSLLSYGESLRALTDVESAAVDKSPRATMPCKVLSILKEEGEVLKVGEIAMVVESMKMEMNILGTAEGKFNAKFKKGDAVEEGQVLFTVT
ncbi:Carbamoyl-phosphate synthase L chain, ATP binding domain containing protein [Hyaloscypha variabilis]